MMCPHTTRKMANAFKKSIQRIRLTMRGKLADWVRCTMRPIWGAQIFCALSGWKGLAGHTPYSFSPKKENHVRLTNLATWNKLLFAPISWNVRHRWSVWGQGLLEGIGVWVLLGRGGFLWNLAFRRGEMERRWAAWLCAARSRRTISRKREQWTPFSWWFERRPWIAACSIPLRRCLRWNARAGPFWLVDAQRNFHGQTVCSQTPQDI